MNNGFIHSGGFIWPKLGLGLHVGLSVLYIIGPLFAHYWSRATIFSSVSLCVRAIRMPTAFNTGICLWLGFGLGLGLELGLLGLVRWDGFLEC